MSNNIFIIDTGKPEGQEAIKALIEIGRKLAEKEKPLTDWVRPDRAREILGGGTKPVTDAYLKKLRDEKLIRFTELTTK